jgi:hypothetical protein
VGDVMMDQSREPTELATADEQLLRELTERARAGGLQLTGEGGLLGKADQDGGRGRAGRRAGRSSGLWQA